MIIRVSMTQIKAVYNVKTGSEVSFYTNRPIQALISAAMLRDQKAKHLEEKKWRESYQRKVRYRKGMVSAFIGDLFVWL